MVQSDPRPTLIIGIGNEFRRDDGAGIMIARRTREICPPEVVVQEESGEGASLMEAWANFATVILIDAVSSGSPIGKIHRLNPLEGPIPTEFFHYSTHAFSIAEAVEMARALGRLPERMVIYGIEGNEFGWGTGLSPEVEEVLDEVVDLILRDLDLVRSPSGTSTARGGLEATRSA